LATSVREYLFADESGNFDFSRKKDVSRYFILAAVTMDSCSNVNADFHDLRHQMAWEGHDHPGPYHAAQDPAPVRNRVYGLIENLEFRVDAVILEKAKAMPKIRVTDERFYQHAWFYLMKYAVRRLQCDELLVVSAALGNKKKKRLAFHAVVQDVMRQVSRVTYKTACWHASSDACLQGADYCGWALQRRWEAGDSVAYNRIAPKVKSQYDLFAAGTNFYY
jgi:hypothetical protein